MKAMLLCLAGAMAVALSPATLAAGDANAGKSKTAVCAGCHGVSGASLAPNFPNLAGLGDKYLLKQLRDIQSGQRTVPEMSGLLKELNAQDLADIAAYFAAQPRQWAGAKDDAKAVALGATVYRAGNLDTGVPACTGCHSPVGNGNAPAGYPALGGQHPEYLAKQLRAFRDGAHDAAWPGARGNDENAIMRGVAAHMTDQEIAAVANFIAGLK
ncbi:MAG: cytochrome c4 [Porticoccaceae bacterium]|nr:MAG: cytochrome c4 [Porticoccaceae bacterium]